MKKIITYFSLAAVVTFGATSCEGFLDQESQTAISTPEAITSVDDAISALNGVYDMFQGNSGNTSYYQTYFLVYGDVRGDMMQSSNIGNRTPRYYELIYNADNAPTPTWSPAYNAIRRANNVIGALAEGKAVGATDAQISSLKGQCLALRALAHFDLTRLYCQPYTKPGAPKSYGVPIVLDSPLPSYTPGRDPLEKVYEQVIKDLQDAITALETTGTGYEKKTGYVNKWVAMSLLSRVYLYQGNYEQALKYAEMVIEGEGMTYTLWTTDEYATSWNKPGSSELMFELVNQDLSDFGDLEAIGNLMSEEGYAEVIATPTLVEYFKNNPSDVRGGCLTAAKTDNNINRFGKDKVFCLKFPGRGPNTALNNTPVMRLSEVYLNAAEAAVQLGGANQEKANKYLNKIIQRANPAAPSVVATLPAVLQQRGIELFGEGHRAYDLMRNNITVVRNTANRYNYPILKVESYDWNTTTSILPIPKSERDANPIIRDQNNPGY